MLLRLPADFHVALFGKKVSPSPSARHLAIGLQRKLTHMEASEVF